MEKRNQHFVPLFLLRKFSWDGKGKTIGIFNKKDDKYIQAGTLKTQGVRKYTYGKNPGVENSLQMLETLVSPIISMITESKHAPVYKSESYFTLLAFAISLDLRNPHVSLKMYQETEEFFKALLGNEYHEKQAISEERDSNNKLWTLLAQMQNLFICVDMCSDLSCKVIYNNTNHPFIISDTPLIKYNQFLESRSISYGTIGFGTRGLQLFLPISPEIMVVFYDQWIYKYGCKKQKTITISDNTEIQKLNELQCINCNQTLFFNNRMPEDQIRTIYDESVKSNKLISPLILKARRSLPEPDQNNFDSFYFLASESNQCNFSIKTISLTKQGRHCSCNNHGNIRPHAKEVRKHNNNGMDH